MARPKNERPLADSEGRLGFGQRFLKLLLLAGFPYSLMDFVFRFPKDGLISFPISVLSGVSFAFITALAVHVVICKTRK
jgi:hypothetical protein